MEKEIFRYLKWAFTSFSVLFILVIIFIFTPYFSELNFAKSGAFGDTIAGLSAAFIGSLGVIFTFLAFWSQFQANQLQVKQFQRQTEDSIFFKLIDSQNLRITTSKIIIDGKEYGSFQLLEEIGKNTSLDLKQQLCFLARKIICETPKNICEEDYRKMFEINAFLAVNPKEHVADIFERLMTEFFEKIEKLDIENRWRFIEVYFDRQNDEGLDRRRLLESIGRYHFYKVDFEKRFEMYEQLMKTLDSRFGSFLDGHLKGWEFIATYSSTSLNKNTYFQYISSQLSKFEVVILYYYLVSGRASKSFYSFAKELNIFNNVDSYNTLLVDHPSVDNIQQEINNINKRHTTQIENI